MQIIPFFMSTQDSNLHPIVVTYSLANAQTSEKIDIRVVPLGNLPTCESDLLRNMRPYHSSSRGVSHTYFLSL